MKVALLQVNPLVGDLAGNAGRILSAARQAGAQGADLCLTPELALLGYPPRDVLLHRGFIAASWEVLEDLARQARDLPPLLVGLAEPNASPSGKPLFNCAALLSSGTVAGRFRKTLLPTYDVFDEDRYFEPGAGPGFFTCAGRKVAVTVCEDIWNDTTFWDRPLYHADPLSRIAAQGADLLVNLSSSPFTLGKQQVRRRMLAHIASSLRLPVCYCNQVGGNDDLVFAGRSMAFGADGRLLALGKAFAEDVLVVDLDPGPDQSGHSPHSEEDGYAPEPEAWRALVLGTRDYVRKCGFTSALLGLSGGVDSSLTAAVAAEALGPDNVLGVLMPSPYSSPGSVADALALARNLGMPFLTIPIGPLMEAFAAALAGPFAGLPPDVTEENIQSRIRGNLLMALSNKRGAMLLTTGNKSELAVGYCTIYGDMSGGLAVISDVPKTLVYGVCRWLNAQRGELIPAQVLDKAPSAELRPGQTDQDSLPPYAVLDAILERMVRMEGVERITAAGFDRDTVLRVAGMVKAAEFKRKQAPPGLRITDRAFGAGWRMPIASAFRFQSGRT